MAPEGHPLTTTFQIKRKLYDDPRYDAVASSSLREELFKTFVKAGGSNVSNDANPSTLPGPNDIDEGLSKQERKERAVREREGKVRSERGKIEFDINKSKMGMDREEGERVFR